MAAPVIGRVAYHAGTEGTVTLGKSDILLGLWCVSVAGGGTVSVDGGDDIPLVAGVPFQFGIESRTPEWVGKAIVFTGTDSYFVKYLGPLNP